MNRLLIPLFLFIQFLGTSCSNQKKQSEKDSFNLASINIWRNGNQIDTTYSQLNSINFKDSIYYLNYTEINFDGDTVIRDYELPISKSIETFEILKDTSGYRLHFEGLRYLRYGKNYIAYKYLFDDPEGDDEEINYYLIPEFGFVIIRSRAWGSYSRLISNSNPDEFDDIFFLTEKIVEDLDGFSFK